MDTLLPVRERRRILGNKTMPNASVETPDWLRQMESILEELNEGVIIIDNQLHVVFANETLTRLVQYERGEIQGHRPDVIFPPEDIPHLLRQHELRQRYGRNRQEFYLPRKDGQKVPVIFSGRTVRGPDGQEYGLVTVTDISEQKRIEEQLRERQGKSMPNSRSPNAYNSHSRLTALFGTTSLLKLTTARLAPLAATSA